MHYGLLSYILGACSALLIGFSKTGMPGMSIPGILLMAEAFPNDAQLSVIAILPIILVGDVFAVSWYHHHAQWRRLWGLFPWVIAGMVPGAVAFYMLDGNRMRPVLGVLVLGMLIFELWRQWRRKSDDYTQAESDAFHQTLSLKEKLFTRHFWFVGFTGLLAGFATFLANAAMPVMSVYLISQEHDKHEFIGTAAWFFFLLNIVKMPIYYVTGGPPASVFMFDLFLSPVVLLGCLLGVYILGKIPQKMFNAMALIMAGLAAIRLIVA